MDEKLALLWLQKAAEGGHEKAQCELSETTWEISGSMSIKKKPSGMYKKLQKEAAPKRRI